MRRVRAALEYEESEQKQFRSLMKLQKEFAHAEFHQALYQDEKGEQRTRARKSGPILGFSASSCRIRYRFQKKTLTGKDGLSRQEAFRTQGNRALV
jgi:hypothetical protein